MKSEILKTLLSKPITLVKKHSQSKLITIKTEFEHNSINIDR